MANIAPFIPSSHISKMTIEQLLVELAKYCFPRLNNQENDDTWHASGAMRIKTKGAEFTVRTSFNEPDAKTALMLLLYLVEQAVEELGNQHINKGTR